MIDWDASAELNECSVEWLKSVFDVHPHSHKEVVMICDGCGKIRNHEFRYHRDMCKKCKANTPDERQSRRLSTIKHFSDPAMREAARLRTINQMSAPAVREEVGRKAVEYYINHPEAREAARLKSIEQWSDPDACEKMSDITREYYKTHPESGYKHSASMQGQDYDAGEWTGYTDKARPHITPINHCIQLNERFVGSEGHHITKSVVVFIPKELHEHIAHNIRTGDNMGEINVLAIQFINGGLEL